MTSSSSSDHILLPIGYIRKPHGLKGEVKVHLYNDKYSELLETLNSLIINEKTFVIEQVRWQHDCALLKLETINDATKAGEFRKLELTAIINPNNKILKSDRFFLPEEWIEFKTFDENGKYVGIVSEIIYTKSNDVISIQTETEEELVPVTEEYITSIDLTNKSLTINKPDYL